MLGLFKDDEECTPIFEWWTDKRLPDSVVIKARLLRIKELLMFHIDGHEAEKFPELLCYHSKIVSNVEVSYILDVMHGM